ncbi:hypothetical protein GBA63_00585 [Rubrobacter tropicus]|uniref:Uncharacterized protein n=1 Tax=Rubrobacter tropicus TaxID=2653851 RepID=A0A6G8Q4A9_9ACTN|nr:hypothetical protein [Rubrobacter tropicus]QIN81280.1 hypothetical protein GBA63_00585 [Rubrobacter tropicus]
MRPRVLLANEPRSYRQAIAGALQALRPDVEFEEIEPETLDAEVVRRGPQLVICSRATRAVQAAAPSWVELYADYGTISSVSIHLERTTVEGMEISDLLQIVDRAVASVMVEASENGFRAAGG